MIPKLPALFIFLATCGGSAYGQLEKIDTDRPDQTESAFTVPKNWLQFEAGFTSLAHTDADIDRTLAAARTVMSQM